MCVLACINENLLDLSDLSIHVQHEYALIVAFLLSGVLGLPRLLGCLQRPT